MREREGERVGELVRERLAGGSGVVMLVPKERLSYVGGQSASPSNPPVRPVSFVWVGCASSLQPRPY